MRQKKTALIQLVALLCVMALSVSMTGCEKKENGDQTESTERVTQTTQASTEESLVEETQITDNRLEMQEDEQLESDNLDNEDYEEQGADESSGGSSSAVSGTTTGQQTPLVTGGIGQKLTWSALNAFPIKNATMSTAELRKLCVDFFRFSKTALWTPSKSISYIRTGSSSDSMNGGSLYGGLPYVGSGSGKIYRLMDYIDESTGVVDMADALNGATGKISAAGMKYFGNQCANGALTGWGRVINSVSGYSTNTMTEKYGYIKLGNYTYNQELWKETATTAATCRANGEQVMYQAYALLKPADGLVYYTTAGHVIMCSSEAHVEYEAGTKKIDGNKSYITIIDQNQFWKQYSNEAGKVFTAESNVDAKHTFRQLFERNYVPFTFGEFQGKQPVEATSCQFSYKKATITASQLFASKVAANYGICDVYAVVTDSSGKEVYRHAVRNPSAFRKNVNIVQSGDNVDSWGTLQKGTVKVLVQLATGERITVYSGSLTV